MGMRDACKALASSSTLSRLVFNWTPGVTHVSNVVKTTDARIDVHQDLSNPGWAVAIIQVNKGAKDPGAKEFLSKGNKGSHKTTHKNFARIRYSQVNFNETGFQEQVRNAFHSPGATFEVPGAESSTCIGTDGSDGLGSEKTGNDAGQSSTAGASMGKDSSSAIGNAVWEWDARHKLHKYWDGKVWVHVDTKAGRDKCWDEVNHVWQWRT